MAFPSFGQHLQFCTTEILFLHYRSFAKNVVKIFATFGCKKSMAKHDVEGWCESVIMWKMVPVLLTSNGHAFPEFSPLILLPICSSSRTRLHASRSATAPRATGRTIGTRTVTSSSCRVSRKKIHYEPAFSVHRSLPLQPTTSGLTSRLSRATTAQITSTPYS